MSAVASAVRPMQAPTIAPETRARDLERLQRELARARSAAADLAGARVETRPALATQPVGGAPVPPIPPVPPVAPLPAQAPTGADAPTTTLPNGAQIRSGPGGTTIIRTPGGHDIIVDPQRGILNGDAGRATTESGFPPRNDDIPPEVVPLVGTVFGTIAATIVLFPLARAWARRMDRKATPAPAEVTSRLDRIEQAIETIAIEVERVSEAQRYSAKLLTDRLPDTAALRAVETESVR